MQSLPKVALIGVVIGLLSILLTLPTFANDSEFCRRHPNHPSCLSEYEYIPSDRLDNLSPFADELVVHNALTGGYKHVSLDELDTLTFMDEFVVHNKITGKYEYVPMDEFQISDPSLAETEKIPDDPKLYEPKMIEPPTYEPPSFNEVGDPSLDNTEATCVLWGYNVNTGERECVIYSQY